MKITPLEIRQKTFERTLRGYDKDEVNGFLLSLSQEWERNSEEIRELKAKLESCDREISKLREVETSLFKTLKTAEDTGANVIEQANKAAELHLREAQIRAEALLNEARDRAKNTIEESDATAKQLLGEMEDQIKGLIQQYKTLESHRNNMVDDLKRLANEVLDRANRAKQSSRKFDADDHLAVARKEVKKSLFPSERENKRILTQPEAAQPVQEPIQSFFDEVV
jgi:cell division initiation protein